MKQTKQNIMDAFWDIYCVKNITNITVKEITERAGYNRSTFYEYFTDVYDLLNQLEESLLPQIDELPPSSLLSETSFSIDAVMDMYSKYHKHYTVLLGDNGDPAFADKLKCSIKAKIIEFTNDISLEFDYKLEYILSAMIGILTYWYKCDQNLPQEKLITVIRTLS